MNKASLPHPLRTTRSQIFYKRFESISDFKNHLMLEPTSCKLHELRREYCARKEFKHYYQIKSPETLQTPTESPDPIPRLHSLSPVIYRTPTVPSRVRKLNIQREIHRIHQFDKRLLKSPLSQSKQRSPMISQDRQSELNEGWRSIKRSSTEIKISTPLMSIENSRNISPPATSIPQEIKSKIEDIYSVCNGFIQNLQHTRRIGKRTQTRLKGKLKICSKKVDHAIESPSSLPIELISFKTKMNELRFKKKSDIQRKCKTVQPVENQEANDMFSRY